MSRTPTLVWFRQDLRLADNPSLLAAIERGGPVIPVFIWAPEEEGAWAPGGASRWWLHQSLAALEASLRAAGSRLILRCGPSLPTLQALARETGAGAVHWSRRYEPEMTRREAMIQDALRGRGLIVESFNAALLHEPWTIRNQSRKPFQVFTPFWNHCLGRPEPDAPRPAPSAVPGPGQWPDSTPLAALGLEPRLSWADGMRAVWTPGEAGGQRQAGVFVRERLAAYAIDRDSPGLAGTSRLSAHLHFGEIGPRQVWHLVRRAAEAGGIPPAVWRKDRFLTELGWREFAHHLLFHFPRTPTEPLRAEFSRFPWREEPAWLAAWQRGRTGYPIVDAGMRELWSTGWMHNRVRMIVASFLVKDLLISWTEGARWFWDTLVDADLAQNTLGWQWCAGCGADAAPFFRVFNPISQGEKFDAAGSYVRRWVPELARLPDDWLHQPWDAPAEVLRAAGVEIGRSYPEPIVSHAIAREVALEALARLRGRP